MPSRSPAINASPWCSNTSCGVRAIGLLQRSRKGPAAAYTDMPAAREGESVTAVCELELHRPHVAARAPEAIGLPKTDSVQVSEAHAWQGLSLRPTQAASRR